MAARVQAQQTQHVVTVLEPEETSTRDGEPRLATRLGVAFAVVAAAEFVLLLLVPGLRSLLAVLLAYSVALMGALLVGSLRDRRRRLTSALPARVTCPPFVGANSEAEDASAESRRAA